MTVSAEQLGDGIYRITLPLPFVNPPSVNCYVIEGDHGVTVIDCGTDDGRVLSELQQNIEQLVGSGVEIDRLICTHLHPDHAGGARSFLDGSDAAFTMHGSVSQHLDSYNDWNIERAAVADLARRHGVPSDELDLLDFSLERPGWAGVAIEPTEPVIDGQKITIGQNRTLEVIHTPGHHPTHICLLDDRTGRLFSGDHVLPRITPFIPHRPDGDALAEYLDGLERVELLDPGVTLPAHGETIEEGRMRARQIALHHERRLGAMIQVTHPNGATAWTVMREVFRPNLSPDDRYLAFQETLAHLEYLANLRKLRRTDIDGTWIYGR